MYDMKDILDRLNAGASAQDIANEFVDALNSAVQEQKATAQREEEEKTRAKLEDATKLRDAFVSYLSKYHPTLAAAAEEFAEWKGEDVMKTLDRVEKDLMPIIEMSKRLQEVKKNVNTGKQDKAARGATGDPIADFLRSNGLL